jgi:ParB family transcriptional regulator, chromosome partitioning protein
MKRDLLFTAERLAALANESHLAALARQYGIRRAKENDSIPKLYEAYLRQSEESIIGSLVVQLAVLLAAARGNGIQVLREAATVYKVDTEAIAAKVKREFADREKAKGAKKPAPKLAAKATKKATAQPGLNRNTVRSLMFGLRFFMSGCPSCPPLRVAPANWQERQSRPTLRAVGEQGT